MGTEGQHLILDVWLSEKVLTATVERVLQKVRMHFSVMKEVFHEFEPIGLTYVCILAESHFTVHTYPEFQYMSMDLYVCNPEVDLKNFAAQILSVLDVKTSNLSIFKRGQVCHTTSVERDLLMANFQAGRI